jgi:serine/threonine-protein kinase
MEGTPFGRYRLVELLGRGGMGEVWRAHDTDTDRIVAIKLLPAHFSENEEFQKRFRREAHAAAGLNSPHVVPIHNYGEIAGRLYVDMRLIEGRDLQSVLAEGPLEPKRAVRIIEGVALALHAAHQIGLVHRDVKPSNILLDGNDFAYLIDFGIARAADETRMTQTGNTIGTFQYIAPERLGTGGVEDGRVDIYSLACVLYECLAGDPPFDSDTMAHLVAAHLSTPPPRPSITQPNVPAHLDEVIATGMAKDPDERYATTVELANAAHDAITVPIKRPAPAPTLLPTTQQADNLVTAEPSTVKAESLAPAKPAAPLPPTPPAPRQPWWRRKAIVIPAALLTVAVIVAAIVTTSQPHESSNGPQTTLPTGSQTTLPTSTQHREPAYGPQVTLPFTVKQPAGVAVDTAGNLYVTDFGNNRVLKLAAGSSTQSVLPFTGLNQPFGVAVDSAGNLYVADNRNNRVLELAAGSSTPTVLPFTGLSGPAGVAVDAVGNLYVGDAIDHRVVKLAAGSATQTDLPFTGLNAPFGVAVDTAGNLYVTDYRNNQVLKLAAGSSTQTVLPFPGSWGVAVDSAGNLYVADGGDNRVLKLAAGSNTQTVLPFTGLATPEGVAVDTAGNLYVGDGGNQVLKLPAG